MQWLFVIFSVSHQTLQWEKKCLKYTHFAIIYQALAQSTNLMEVEAYQMEVNQQQMGS